MRPKIGDIVIYKSNNIWYKGESIKECVGEVVYENRPNFWIIRRIINERTYLADNAYTSEMIVIAKSYRDVSDLEKLIYNLI